MAELTTLTELNVIIVENTKNLESVLPDLGETFAIDWYSADFFECLVKRHWVEATTGYSSTVLFQEVDNVINIYTTPRHANKVKEQVRHAIAM